MSESSNGLHPDDPNNPRVVRLSKVFSIFIKLGAIGFGGPVALIALMEKELCGRLGWITSSSFSEATVLCKLLPGPVAFQMAVWAGNKLRGKLGGCVAGVSFLLPGFILILLLGIFYQSIPHNRWVNFALEGMRLGALAIIVDSIWRMFKPYKREIRAYIYLFIGFVSMLLFPRWEPLIILMGGLSGILGRKVSPSCFSVVVLPLKLLQLFWCHFKAGAFVFGTGLAIVPFLENDAVRVYQWLSSEEFLDAIAFGQITPGPVTITSAFIGYRAAGMIGACVAALGMYLPGIIFILIGLPIILKHVGESQLSLFQRGAIPTVIGCIAGAGIILGLEIVQDPLPLGICLSLVGVSIFSHIPGWILILLGALVRSGIGSVIEKM